MDARESKVKIYRERDGSYTVTDGASKLHVWTRKRAKELRDH